MTSIPTFDFLERLSTDLVKQDISYDPLRDCMRRISSIVNRESSLDDNQQAAVRAAILEFKNGMTKLQELQFAATLNTFMGSGWRLRSYS